MTILNKDKILETAKDFVSQGKFDKAIREYEKILAADSKDMRVKLRIAELFAKRREIPQAIQAYQEVAESYALEGFYLKAVTVYKSILRLNPSLLEVNKALSDLYEKMGLNQDAIHQYEILASAYEQKNQFPKALKIRQRLVELAPQESAHRIRLTESYQREEKKEEAIEQYEILAKQFREQKKEPARLIELYERILPYRPQNKEMLADLVSLYYEKKDYKGALKWLEQSKQAAAKDAKLLALQAEMYGILNQIESARGKYQELADLYLEQGDSQKALQAYVEILALLPEEPETVKERVEQIQKGIFDEILRKGDEKRRKKQEEAKTAEETKEKEKEEKEKLKEIPKKEIKTPMAKPIAKAMPKDQDPITSLWNKARSAVELARAYLAQGLEDEAMHEQGLAKEVLKKILELDGAHAEAKRLLEELEPKGKKKISFV